MNALDPLRPTVVPALLYLAALPIFLLLPKRGGAAPAFFIVSSLAFITLIDGPAFALGIGGACVLAYFAVERVARWPREAPARRVAFAVLVIGLHAIYLGCFFLPVPEAYRRFVPRGADQAPVMVLFSGIGLTFFRVLSFAHDRASGRIAGATLGDFLAYVLFFPQFRHGPIERFATLSPQLSSARQRWQPRDLGRGLLRILLTYAALAAGLAMLFCISWLSGALGRMTDLAAAVRSPSSLTLVDVMVLVHLPAAMLYALEWGSAGLQLGASRCYAVRGTENFDHVWRMSDPADCWRRWQTTLGAWIRDYAFRPLVRRTRSANAAIVLTFVYCGLLHGPQPRCLVWGLYNGLTVAVVTSWSRRRRGASGPRPTAARALSVFVGRAALYIWISVGVTILIDPDGCGVPLLRRYLTLLAKGLGIGA